MMFENLCSFFNYCDHCPFCNKKMEIELGLHPDTGFAFTSFEVIENNRALLLRSTMTDHSSEIDNHSISVDFEFDTEKNKFKLFIYDPYATTSPLSYTRENELLHQLKDYMPYFYFNVTCCNIVFATQDIELGPDTNKITEIGLEFLDIFFLDYIIKHNYGQLQKMSISHENGTSIQNLPIYDFDFSDQQKFLDKIQNFINFS